MENLSPKAMKTKQPTELEEQACIMGTEKTCEDNFRSEDPYRVISFLEISHLHLAFLSES